MLSELNYVRQCVEEDETAVGSKIALFDVINNISGNYSLVVSFDLVYNDLSVFADINPTSLSL